MSYTKKKISNNITIKKKKYPSNEFVFIKKSKIHGLGVFAKRDIPKNTKIVDYYGKEMSWKNFTKKYGPYKDNSVHTYPMRRIWKILVAKSEPWASKNIVNWINENQKNTNVILKKRALYAIKDIKKNHELFLYYPKQYNRNWI